MRMPQKTLLAFGKDGIVSKAEFTDPCLINTLVII
jgi:hypothetical protein